MKNPLSVVLLLAYSAAILSISNAGVRNQIIQAEALGNVTFTSGGITSLNSLESTTQTFSSSGSLTITSSGSDHHFSASTSPYYGGLTATGTIAFTSLSSGLVANNNGTLYSGIATSSATCSGSVSCSSFTVVGGVSPTILGTGASFAWTPSSEGNSTSTRILLGNGFISSASSTVNSSLTLSGSLIVSSSATSTFKNGLQLTGGTLQTVLTGCNGNSVLETDASGNLQCGSDASGAGTLSMDWQKEMNFGVLNLTPTTTIPVWMKDSLNASNTLRVNGLSSLASISATGTLDVSGLSTLTGVLSTASSTFSNTLMVSGQTTLSSLSSGLLGNNSGVLYGGIATGTVSGTNGITVTAARSAIGGALAIDCTVASASAAGCLSTTDYNSFNSRALFSFTPTAYGNSTSSIIGFTGGLMSMASSTFSSTLFTSGLLTMNGGFVSYASSTINASTFDISPSTVLYHSYPSLPFATSTVSSTTNQTIGPAVPKQTWVSSACSFGAGQIVAVQFTNGSNNLDYIIATGTSIVTTTFTKNNSFSQGSIMGVVSSSSAPYIGGCTLDRVFNK